MEKKRKKEKKNKRGRKKNLSLSLSLFLSFSFLLLLRSPLLLSRLVPARVASPAGLLELAPLGAHVRLRRRTRNTGGRAKVLDGLPRRRLAAQQHAVAPRRRGERELVERQDLPAGGDDAGAGALGDAERRDAELGHVEQARVVGDGSDNRGRLALLALHEFGELGERERGAVGLGHVEAAEDDGVELGVGPAGEELVELFDVFVFFFVLLRLMFFFFG